MRSIALVALVPFAAFAQSPTPEPAAPAAAPPPVSVSEPVPPDRASWSLGAGIAGTNVYVFTAGSAMLVIENRTPSAIASLERRLSGGTWLVLGLDGSYDRRTTDNAAGTGVSTKDELLYGRLSAGVRHVVTPARAPVDVSFVALATAARTRLKSTTEFSGVETTNESEAWSVGAEGGIAIDRVLTGGLSVRVATPLVQASWGKATATPGDGGPEVKYDDVAVVAVIAPRLELRLAF